MSSTENPVVEEIVTGSKNEKILLSYDQRLQLEEQIRMFVQLLTQFYLLSCRNLEELSFLNESSKKTLVELNKLASENNIFNAFNLTSALAIVNEFEEKKKSTKIPKKINCIIGKTIMNSKVFIYPELLPRSSLTFITFKQSQKVTFTNAEDNLIALGLERFSAEPSPIHEIQKHLLPSKAVSQIKFRIKNLKASKALDNPIKYYARHKEAPPMPRNVKIFDPNKVKAPKDCSFKDMPEWIISLISKSRERIPRQILPVSVKDYKPPFILPAVITMQNGNVFIEISSGRINEENIKAKKNKPPFILPKSILKKNKELHSDLVNLPDLQSNSNNNSKNGSIQDCVLKNNAAKSFDVSNNKSNESNNTYDSGTTQNIDKSLIMLNNKNKENNNKEVIVIKKEILDEPMTEHFVLPGNGIESNISVDAKNDKIQSTVVFLSLNDNKTCEKNNIKDVNKINGTLSKNLAKKNNVDVNLRDKLRKSSDRVVAKPLCMIDDENNVKKECNSSSSTSLSDIKYHNQPVIPLLNNKSNAVSLKRQNVSKTIDYFPDPTNKECGVIIKSEIIEEGDESVKEDSSEDCANPDSFLFSITQNNTVQNVKEKGNVKALCAVNEGNNLAEVASENNVINKKRFESLNDACTDNIISNKYSSLQTESHKFTQLQRNRFIERKKNSLREQGCINKQNSNFVETKIENKDNQNFVELSASSKIIYSQFVPHIKQEMTDDCEIAQACESAYDMDINKSNTSVKPLINGKKDIEDLRSTLNRSNVTKTIDYLQCSTDEECDVVIKSEITEETTELSEDEYKVDFSPEKTLHVDFSASAKDYKASLRKRTLRSSNQCTFTKKKKTVHDSSNSPSEFSSSMQRSCDLRLMQYIKCDDEIAKIDFTENVNECRKDISIKSKIIQNYQTVLHSDSLKIFNKPILRSTKNIIQSNSLEKAQLKKSNKRIKQKRRKQNYQAKRKLRKRS